MTFLFVAIEGSDGAGKATQHRLLCGKLAERPDVHLRRAAFPEYDLETGAMIRRYLAGEFGDLESTSPYLVSLLYSVNRLEATRRWFLEAAEDEGSRFKNQVLVADRFTYSNFAHQAAKLTATSDADRDTARQRLLRWLELVEFEIMRLPKPELTLFLDLPTDVAAARAAARADGAALDLHERNAPYLERVREEYLWLCRSRSDWARIDCYRDGQSLSASEVHSAIWSQVEPLLA